MTFHLSSLISGSVRIDDDLPHNRASAVHAGANGRCAEREEAMAAFREEFDRVPEQYGREAGLRAAKSESRRGWNGGFQGPGVEAGGSGPLFLNAHFACWFKQARVATGRILTAECAPRSNP